jgi:hypothetical protein
MATCLREDHEEFYEAKSRRLIHDCTTCLLEPWQNRKQIQTFNTRLENRNL